MSDAVFEQTWMPAWMVETLRTTIRTLFKMFARVEVQGMENFPASGGFIISPNHLSRLDSPLVFSLLAGRKITAFVADSYRRQPFFYPIIRALDVIWVRRGSIGPSTLKYAIKALRQGSILGVAPEGTRSQSGALAEGKTGAAFLALTAGVPIVPVAVNNPEKILPAILRLRRQLVTVTVGQPLVLRAQAGSRLDAQTLERFTIEIMCQLAALLPPERRGVYADHPRLKDLLAGGRAPTGAAG